MSHTHTTYKGDHVRDQAGEEAFAVAVAVALVSVLLAACGSEAPQDGPLVDRIDAARERGSGARLTFTVDGLPRFERLYIVRPYESAESVRRRLGFKAPDVEGAAPRSRDDIALVVLTSKDRVVSFASYPRGRVDFACVDQRDGIPAARASFVLRSARDDGRLVPRLADAPVPKHCV